MLLHRYRYAVDARHLHIAVADSIVSPLNSVLGALERLAFGRGIARQSVSDPLFVLGHWRSGTTLLHELLALDPENACPTTYQCCVPHHFLLTERALPRLLAFLVPGRRPFDDMELRWNSPFEEEFAACLLGARSPYEWIAFPNAGGMRHDLFDPDALSPTEARHWRSTFLLFLRKLTLRYPGRRLVLKSPPHMCRIRTLLEFFPGARFVHIVRNPYETFPSTLHLWRVMHGTQGLQTPDVTDLGETVLSTFLHLHRTLQRDWRLIPERQRHELRFEDLLRDPSDEMAKLYDHLQVDASPAMRTLVEGYFGARAAYSRNRYVLAEADRERVGRRWEEVIRRYGYDGPLPRDTSSRAIT